MYIYLVSINTINANILVGSQAVIELLLKYGVDVNAKPNDELPIVMAMKLLDKDTVEYLLTQKIQSVVLNSTPQMPLRIPPLHAISNPFTFGKKITIIDTYVSSKLGA